MAVLTIIALTILAAANAIPLLELNQEWNRFLATYNPEYQDSAEYDYRKKIFEANLENIQKHNVEYDLGLHTYRKGINQFVDKTSQELASGFLGFSTLGIRDHIKQSQQTITLGDSKDIPESIDWRKTGGVTPVKDQGRCGSCWAFSAIGALEGQYYRLTNKSVSLSEQVLVDCSASNYGCNGGDMVAAYVDLMDMGVATEKSYPYKGKTSKCTFDETTAIANVTGLTYWSFDEEQLKVVVATHGAISAAIEVTNNFMQYTGGIFYDEECSDDDSNLNHGVLVVGYGSENGTDYWIVKNSWGSKWGEEGYIKMSRNRNNNCMISTDISYPHVKIINH